MTRLEFSRRTRRDALKRADGACEASGTRYGLAEDVRCNAPLAYGVEFDHDLPAELNGDNSLENCRAICVKCHRAKSRYDIQGIRKADRQRDKRSGAMKPKGRPIPGSHASGWRHRIDGTWERR